MVSMILYLKLEKYDEKISTCEMFSANLHHVLRVCRKLTFRKFFTSGTYCTLSLNGTFWRSLAHCDYDGVIHSATKKISDQNGLIQEIL